MLSAISTPPLRHPDTPWRTSESVCKGEVEGRERFPSLEQVPLTCRPLYSCAWGHFPRMHPSPHITFFTSSPRVLMLKTAKGGCSLHPFSQDVPCQEGSWCSCECPRASAQDPCPKFNSIGSCAGKAGPAQSQAWGCSPGRLPSAQLQGHRSCLQPGPGPELPSAPLFGLHFPPLTFHPRPSPSSTLFLLTLPSWAGTLSKRCSGP